MGGNTWLKSSLKSFLRLPDILHHIKKIKSCLTGKVGYILKNPCKMLAVQTTAFTVTIKKKLTISEVQTTVYVKEEIHG